MMQDLAGSYISFFFVKEGSYLSSNIQFRNNDQTIKSTGFHVFVTNESIEVTSQYLNMQLRNDNQIFFRNKGIDKQTSATFCSISFAFL